MGCCLLVVNKLGEVCGGKKLPWGQLVVTSVVHGPLHYKSKNSLNRNICSQGLMKAFMKSPGFQEEELWNREVFPDGVSISEFSFTDFGLKCQLVLSFFLQILATSQNIRALQCWDWAGTSTDVISEVLCWEHLGSSGCSHEAPRTQGFQMLPGPCGFQTQVIQSLSGAAKVLLTGSLHSPCYNQLFCLSMKTVQRVFKKEI